MYARKKRRFSSGTKREDRQRLRNDTQNETSGRLSLTEDHELREFNMDQREEVNAVA